jgi:hypothetical protein
MYANKIILDNNEKLSEFSDDYKIVNIHGIKKYKTLSELKKQDLRTISFVCSKMEKSGLRDYLDKWLFDEHYTKVVRKNSLTHVVGQFANIVCYREIMKRCFNGNDILSTAENKILLALHTKECKEVIEQLHNICPSMFGTFVEYLIQRIVNELTNGKNVFNNSLTLSTYDDRHICFKYEHLENKTNYELKNICKNNKIKGITGKNKDGLIKLIMDNCDCQYYFKGMNGLCKVPLCRINCYKKFECLKYKTKDILQDILITSMRHTEGWGFAPNQSYFDKFYELISSNPKIQSDFIPALFNVCSKCLISENVTFHYQPHIITGAGCAVDIDIKIGDSTLIDIKCVNSTKSSDIKHLFQILGAGCSHNIFIPDDVAKIKYISILNVYTGKLTTFDISAFTKKNYTAFIDILSGNAYKV